MIKKSTVLLSIILITIIFLTGCTQKQDINATGTFNDLTFETENFQIEIYSENSGHPDRDYDFMTYYNKMYEKADYDMDFEVSLGLNFVNKSVENGIENYFTMKDIKVFNKDLKYTEISDNEIIIIYKFDDEAYLTINVQDRTDFYNKEGNLIKDQNYNSIKMEEYDLADMLVKDKDFSNTLSFEISKK